MLLTKAVDIAADGLPSPNQLKRKILIKVRTSNLWYRCRLALERLSCVEGV